MDRKMTDALKAFHSANFGWTRQLRSVWRDPPYHVPAIHASVTDNIIDDFVTRTAAVDPDDEPIGRVIIGPAGFGKTHLIGELRRRVWEIGGWFILLDLVGVKDFWASVALGFLNSLQARTGNNGKTQYERLISLLGEHLGIERQAADIALRHRGSPRELVMGLADLYAKALSSRHFQETSAHRDVVTALILLISEDLDCHSIAHAWLQGMTLDAELVRPFGIISQNEPIKVVNGLSWVMSLVGPTLIAVDQIDAILNASNARARAAGADGEFDETQSIVESMSLGLMNLHEQKHRAVTVISCLEETWNILKTRASAAVTDRYCEPIILKSLPGGKLAKDLVAARLNQAYQPLAFVPPYPTWPFAEVVFEDVGGYSPRQLLKACEAHRQHCIADGQVSECNSFEIQTMSRRLAPSGDIDKVFAAACANADLRPLGGDAGKKALCDLFCDTLELFERQLELPDDIDVAVQRDPDQRRPSLHGRLSFTFHSQGDREQHYCFRLLDKTSPIAFQSRLKAAMTASGITNALKFRHLIILRHNTLPNGPKTKALIDQFQAAGGKFVAPTEDELRTFVALNTVARTKPDGLDSWLRSKTPLFGCGVFQSAGLCPPAFLQGDGAAKAIAIAQAPKTKVLPGKPNKSARMSAPSRAVADGEIAIGHRFANGKLGEAVTLPTHLLPCHMAVIAGAGSGKTVLLRRLIEEAALQDIPSIVLDVNNDLSRLGDAWQERPKGFDDADVTAAEAYHKQVDVVIWTPGVNSGNPIALNLLPDFSAIGSRDTDQNQDETAQAVEMARATLSPFLSGGGQKGTLKQGVLADTMRTFARAGGGTLDDLIALLANLPESASKIGNADKIAGDMADQLLAAVATNPLLQSGFASLDPQQLFYGLGGKTRVSVINLAGLTSDEAKQAFVNQLQMTLFTWIKQHPSPTGRLYVIDEAQNFAPSGHVVASSASASALAAQARKYGLGMIFATQHPKGIENRVVQNCMTHVYGRMNAPNTIEAIKEMMTAKGGAADDIGKLSTGEFYFTTAKYERPVLIHTPLCLSWHPQNPPTADEIVRKARACRQQIRSSERDEDNSSVIAAE
jgi:hypothetical protein